MASSTSQRAWHKKPPDIPFSGGGAFLPLTLILLVLGGAVTVLNYVVLGVSLPLATLLGTVLAFIPLLLLGWYFTWLDAGEPEMRTMFLLAFFWGSVASTGFALVANTISVSLAGNFFGVAVLAPIAEEVAKGALIFFLYWWRRAHFDGPLDGIIYAGFIGMGFAFVENITYFTAAYSGLSLFGDETAEGGPVALLVTFVFRGGLTPFAHPLFTAATGLGLGLASLTKSKPKRFFLGFGGIFFAFILHGLWNGSITAAPQEALGFIYLLFFIPIFALYIVYSLKARKAMNKHLAVALRDLARLGLLHPADVDWLASQKLRQAVLDEAREDSRGSGHAMLAYQTHALHFATLHHKVSVGVPPDSYREIGKHYARELRYLRPHLKPVPPVAALLTLPPPGPAVGAQTLLPGPTA